MCPSTESIKEPGPQRNSTERRLHLHVTNLGTAQELSHSPADLMRTRLGSFSVLQLGLCTVEDTGLKAEGGHKASEGCAFKILLQVGQVHFFHCSLFAASCHPLPFQAFLFLEATKLRRPAAAEKKHAPWHKRFLWHEYLSEALATVTACTNAAVRF